MKREVFIAKEPDKAIYEMKKVHFSIKLIETVLIVILESVMKIAVFFITKEDKGNEREQKNEMGGGVSAPFVQHPLEIEVSY